MAKDVQLQMNNGECNIAEVKVENAMSWIDVCSETHYRVEFIIGVVSPQTVS